MSDLSRRVERKFINSVDVSGWEIDTDSGWQDVTAIHKTVPYQLWTIVTEGGLTLECADTHIVFDHNFNQIFVKDCVPGATFITTRFGPQLVVGVTKFDTEENMFDITVDSDDHRFWTGDILSHNTETVRAFVIHYILFNTQKTVAILADKEATVKEILYKIQLSYENIPQWLQVGVVEYNKKGFVLENGSRIIVAGTSSNSIRGFTLSVLILDEAAHIENFDAFYSSVLPTISAGKNTKLIMTSTPLGLNHFYKFWKDSEEGRNSFQRIYVPWYRVPGRDQAWADGELQKLGGDTEKFAQEYNVEFQGSSGTLIAGWKLKQLRHATPIKTQDGLTEYFTPQPQHNYIMIVDSSRGRGLDYSAFSIIDVTSMPYQQVCTYRNNLIAPLDYAEIVYRVARVYNNCPILVEVNNMGNEVATAIHYDFEYENILFTENAGRAGKRITFGFSKGVDRGVNTTKQVKATGCSILKLLIEQDQLIINDYETIVELSTFSKHLSSYEAEPNCHDDLVMGLVLFGWLSDQEYFKEYTNIHTLMNLREKTDEDVINDLTPFGFVTSSDSDFDANFVDCPPEYNWLWDERFHVEKGFL